MDENEINTLADQYDQIVSDVIASPLEAGSSETMVDNTSNIDDESYDSLSESIGRVRMLARVASAAQIAVASITSSSCCSSSCSSSSCSSSSSSSSSSSCSSSCSSSSSSSCSSSSSSSSCSSCSSSIFIAYYSIP